MMLILLSFDYVFAIGYVFDYVNAINYRHHDALVLFGPDISTNIDRLQKSALEMIN